MSSKRSVAPEQRRTQYEYRVWGKHRQARKVLEKLASARDEQFVDDCYLLVDDVDASFNAKVRNNTLKIKRMIAEHKGFEQWESGFYVSAETVPAPFDGVFDQLRLDRVRQGKSFDLEKAVRRLGADSGVRAIFVRKHRVRYGVGSLRAEVTDIDIRDSGEQLRTLSIQGDDLAELVALRKQLGLRGEPNIAVHEAIDAEIR